MDAEEELYQLACQDMPVTGSEVREAMQEYRKQILENEYPLLLTLIEQHRPVVRKTPMVVNPLMRDAHCPACDGNRWRMIIEGDKVPECAYWTRAKELGLVQDA
jgi:hypothetical protein